MRDQLRSKRLLRWYPRGWRDRYGEEFVALLEDTYKGRRVPLRCRISIVKSGMAEHLYGSGLMGATRDPKDVVRAGALLVLSAWAAFVVAGSGFQKFSEHWEGATPGRQLQLPTDAFTTVQWAAGVGAIVVLAAAACAMPAFVRSLRDGEWSSIRRPVWRALAATATTAVAGVGVLAWAHAIGPHQRNGGSHAYQVVGGIWVLMVISSIALLTSAAVAATSRLRLSIFVLKVESVMAIALSVVMLIVITGTVVWWASIAIDAPSFLSNSLLGATPAPPAMVVIGFLMLTGTLAAAVGTVRVLGFLPRISEH